MGRLGALVALLTLSTAAQGQLVRSEPTCRADRVGENLVTRIEYPDGYAIEGPWHVTRQGREPGAPATVTAVLDHIVEIKPFSRRQQVTPLPGPIEMTFRGKSQEEALNDAARVWCITVVHVRPPGPGRLDAESAPTNRIML